MLRRIVKGVANRHGLDATFMSKPFADQPGSRLHSHASFADAAGRNIFDETTPEGDLFLCRPIAGLQATVYGTKSFFAPDLTAYRR